MQPPQRMPLAMPAPTRAYFNADKSAENILRNLISYEKKGIYACFYECTDPIIINAWIKAHTDKKLKGGLVINKMNGKNEKYLAQLKNAGIEVIQAPNRDSQFNYFHMHHKCIFFEKNFANQSYVLHGSINATSSGFSHQDGVFIATCNPIIVAQFKNQYARMCNQPVIDEKPVDSPINRACFSPHIGQLLVKLIADEHKSIHAACFRFSFIPIAVEWAKKQSLKKEAVESSLIVDRLKNSEQRNFLAIRYLINHQIPVYAYDKENEFHIMHHKFFIFENNHTTHKPLVVTGSFNPTGQAQHANWEDIVVYDEPELVQSFIEEYQRLQKTNDNKRALSVQDIPSDGYQSQSVKNMESNLNY